MNIIDYIGESGVQTSRDSHDRKPSMGDPILVRRSHDQDDESAELVVARLVKVEEGRVAWAYDANVFWMGPGEASISGGPFDGAAGTVRRDPGMLKQVEYWNWGDNPQGAGNGVRYTITAPLWVFTR